MRATAGLITGVLLPALTMCFCGCGGQERAGNAGPGPASDDTAGAPPAKIAFALDGDIYVMRPDGGGRRRLYHGLGEAGRPAWSPARTKIAFALAMPSTGMCEICVVDADGTGLRQPFTAESPPYDVAWRGPGKW